MASHVRVPLTIHIKTTYTLTYANLRACAHTSSMRPSSFTPSYSSHKADRVLIPHRFTTLSSCASAPCVSVLLMCRAICTAGLPCHRAPTPQQSCIVCWTREALKHAAIAYAATTHVACFTGLLIWAWDHRGSGGQARRGPRPPRQLYDQVDVLEMNVLHGSHRNRCHHEDLNSAPRRLLGPQQNVQPALGSCHNLFDHHAASCLGTCFPL